MPASTEGVGQVFEIKVCGNFVFKFGFLIKILISFILLLYFILILSLMNMFLTFVLSHEDLVKLIAVAVYLIGTVKIVFGVVVFPHWLQDFC